jgi:hypothetical protein
VQSIKQAGGAGDWPWKKCRSLPRAGCNFPAGGLLPSLPCTGADPSPHGYVVFPIPSQPELSALSHPLFREQVWPGPVSTVFHREMLVWTCWERTEFFKFHGKNSNMGVPMKAAKLSPYSQISTWSFLWMEALLPEIKRWIHHILGWKQRQIGYLSKVHDIFRDKCKMDAALCYSWFVWVSYIYFFINKWHKAGYLYYHLKFGFLNQRHRQQLRIHVK